jgi:hypothetical protein
MYRTVEAARAAKRLRCTCQIKASNRLALRAQRTDENAVWRARFLDTPAGERVQNSAGLVPTEPRRRLKFRFISWIPVRQVEYGVRTIVVGLEPEAGLAHGRQFRHHGTPDQIDSGAIHP